MLWRRDKCHSMPVIAQAFRDMVSRAIANGTNDFAAAGLNYDSETAPASGRAVQSPGSAKQAARLRSLSLARFPSSCAAVLRLAAGEA